MSALDSVVSVLIRSANLGSTDQQGRNRFSPIRLVLQSCNPVGLAVNFCRASSYPGRKFSRCFKARNREMEVADAETPGRSVILFAFASEEV